MSESREAARRRRRREIMEANAPVPSNREREHTWFTSLRFGDRDGPLDRYCTRCRMMEGSAAPTCPGAPSADVREVAAAVQIRAQALEEAARVAEGAIPGHYTGPIIAAAIRRLKDAPHTGERS